MVGNINKGYHICLLVCVLLIFSNICRGNDGLETYNYGLSFRAHSVNQDQRTSLDLTPEKPLNFSADGFSLNFDIRLKNELYTYGYITRIISNDNTSFDIVSYLLLSKINFILSNKTAILKNTEILDSTKIVADRWIHIDIHFRKNDIQVSIDGTKLEINHSFENFSNIKIHFGSNKHPSFFATDVPPMTIRNINIKDAKGKTKLSWPLSKHNTSIAYDIIQNKKALIKNGIWEIDKHTKWNKLSTYTTTAKNPQIAYDSINGRIFIVTDNKILTYNVNTNLSDTIQVKKGYPFSGASSQVIYDEKRNRLVSYTPDIPHLNIYNFDTNEWSEATTIALHTRQHHNRIINKANDELILFGGYGNHRYNAELCKISLEHPVKWDITSLDSTIFPRYLSTMGQDQDGNILIMGGHGCPTGKQEEFPRNFYDLYKLNVNTGKCKKIWEFTNTGAHFTFGNSMLIDNETKNIYTLTYNNDRYNTCVYLSRFPLDTDKPKQMVMSDSIEYNFLDIYSYSDLFLHRATSSIYAIIQQEKIPGISTIEIYKLAFPPLAWYSLSDKNDISNYLSYFIGILFLIALSTLLIYLYIKRKRKDTYKEQDIISNKATYTEQSYDKKKSAILLLGGFQVYDKAGKNITGDFTPTTKQLFLFLFLNTLRNGKGTTSERLNEAFWYDMDRSKATNNRNVNIRKLRLTIENIGDISITNRNGHWILKANNEINCDYRDIMKLLLRIKAKDLPIDKENVQRIISIASAGQLLPNTSVEWIDDFKAEYANLITEILISATHHPQIKEDVRLMLNISDILLIADSTDEDAIKIKCKILYQTGQKGLSKQYYEKFCIEYKKLLDAMPDFSYEEIIH